ncbi:MAG: T9SS type A sorting domain-containing protein [Parvicellaceae bacterium]
MKKLILGLMFPIIAFGQYTSIPDAVFEQRLIDLGHDTVQDGQILTANIINVDTLILTASSSWFGGIPSISDFTGIEDFTNLTYFECRNNFMSSLDLSQNTSLKFLDCSGFLFLGGHMCPLTNLNLSQNLLLDTLICKSNPLTTLDISQNIALKYIDLSNCKLSNLDLSQNTSLEFLELSYSGLSSLDVSHNNLLKTLYCYHNQLPNLDLTQNIALEDLKIGQHIGGPVGNIYPENYITNIDLSQNVNLTSFDCSYNILTNLDLSNNILLNNLKCNGNQICNLNILQNINLTDIDCQNNNLNFLDVSQNTSLTNLNCRNNYIQYLELSQNQNLTNLDCSNNKINSLDLTQNQNLTNLNCSGNSILNLDLRNGNNNILSLSAYSNLLSCISVDDTAWSDTNWNNISNNTIFSNNCPLIESHTYIPDSMFEQKLIYLGYDSVHDGKVLTSYIKNIDSLDISNSGIIDLTGIEDFLNLKFLNINMNELSNYDISKNFFLENLQCRCSGIDSLSINQNHMLRILDCGNDIFSGINPCQNSNFENNILSINLANNPQLISLGLVRNNLSSLDIRQNPNLTELKCQDNDLEILDLRNGNNTNFTYFNALNNDSLNCIASDDSAWSILNWANIPSNSFFSNYCSDYYTYIPDPVFEIALIIKGYDNILNGYVFTANISNIDTLDIGAGPNGLIHNVPITNLTGIEDFSALTTLYCSENQLSNLDLSQNSGLITLNCYDNQISTLILGQNSALTTLQCGRNLITTLNLSQNLNLTNLNCRYNQLTSLDLSQNPNLLDLNCANNILTSLDLSQNPNLSDLYCGNNLLYLLNFNQNSSITNLNCSYNQFSNLDLSQNPLLSELDCQNNSIMSLDISQNPLLSELDCQNNSIMSLDLSQNPNLNFLNCRANALINLDVRNGNNTNFTTFDSYFNDSLYCISVDDSSWSANNWIGIDSHTSFSNDCNNLQYTLIPDSIFEQRLIDLGYDNIHDGQVLTANISSIDSLDISGIYLEEIEDLTGIQDFTNLLYLDCSLNLLPNLDLSQNTSLTYLKCHTSGISNLDLSQNTALTKIICYMNPQLTSLDLSQNTSLTYLNCLGNFVTFIFGQISDLNLSQNIALDTLLCSGNQLTSLDVSQNVALKYLDCGYNKLTSLDVRNGNNINFTGFDATQNDSLICISVDDSTWSDNNWHNIDNHTSFSNDCNPSSVDIIENLNNILIYPNPTNEEITISINNFNGNIQTEVYDFIGNRLHTTNKTTISLRDYSLGIYLLKVTYGDRVQEVKVIKD